MSNLVKVTVAKGDGIGPEIMDATLKILEAAGARIEPEFVDVGLKAYESGIPTGVTDEAWDSIRQNKIFLKAPLTTPQGGGFKSVNVTLRKSLGLFANVRPTQTFEPFVHSKHANVDLVVVRENEEDLYAGIEYRPTQTSFESLKLLTRSGSERICRYAFEYARSNGRRRVSCLIKDNIMKVSDGMFHKVFREVAADYPDIEHDSHIVDIGMALVGASPEKFDVIVTENLYGDIVSDIASQVSGSVGVAGSMNIGEEYAMFEAVHGSAPDITGKGIANPSGLLNGAILMLHHIGQHDVAVKIQNAWMCAVEDGCHTADIAEYTEKSLSTTEFTDAVIERLGQEPKRLRPVSSEGCSLMGVPTFADCKKLKDEKKECVGADIFVEYKCKSADEFGKMIDSTGTENLKFSLMSSRGIKVYPNAISGEIAADMWRVRYYGQEVTTADVYKVLEQLEELSVSWVKVVNLYNYDGERGYSLCQGE